MSLLPFILGYEQPRSRYWPSRLLDQDFGLTITPDDLLTAVVSPSLSQDYFRPWRNLAAARDVGSHIKADKDKFEITLDVQHFSPEELCVRTADGCVVVSGRHAERRDAHGLVARQFTRRYALPARADAARVESRLSSDGVLRVTAPLRPAPHAAETVVPITHTGPVRTEAKDPAADAGDAPTPNTDSKEEDGKHKDEDKK